MTSPACRGLLRSSSLYKVMTGVNVPLWWSLSATTFLQTVTSFSRDGITSARAKFQNTDTAVTRLFNDCDKVFFIMCKLFCFVFIFSISSFHLFIQVYSWNFELMFLLWYNWLWWQTGGSMLPTCAYFVAYGEINFELAWLGIKQSENDLLLFKFFDLKNARIKMNKCWRIRFCLAKPCDNLLSSVASDKRRNKSLIWDARDTQQH